MKVSGDCKTVAFSALLSALLLAAPALCEDEEEQGSKTNFNFPAKSSSNITSPGSQRTKPLTLVRENSPAAHNPQFGFHPSQTEQEHVNAPAFSDGNWDKEADHDGHKGVHEEEGVRTNHSSEIASDDALSSLHSLFGGHQPSSSFRNSSVHDEVEDSSAHIEKHQLHQASDEDESDLDSTLFHEPKNQPNKAAGSVVVSSGSVPVRFGSNSSNIRDNEQGNKGLVGLRKPIPIVRHEAATKDGSGQVILD